MANNKSFDSITALLLIVIVAGILVYVSGLHFTGQAKTIYYDFNKGLDLNVSDKVSVSSVGNNGKTSLTIGSGYNTGLNDSNIKFVTDFGVNLTNISEYTYNYKLDFSNVSVNGFYLINTFEKNMNLNNATSINDLIDKFDFSFRAGQTTNNLQLASNSGLTSGRDETYNNAEVSIKVNKEQNYVVGTFTYQNNANTEVKYTNVALLNTITTNPLVDNAKVKWLIGNGGTASANGYPNTNIVNGSVTIDYISLVYNQ